MQWLILIAYIVVGWLWPATSWVAIICMVGPVAMSAYRGRFWCGHICPRGAFYSQIIERISRHKRIPTPLRSNGFRAFMLMFIMSMFAVQFYYSWGNVDAMGLVFWRLIIITTIVGIILGVIYSPRAWCTFCPMGTLSAIVGKRSAKAQKWNIQVLNQCKKCTLCAQKCPMQLTPYTAAGTENGYANADCLRCQKCIETCPLKVISFKNANMH